MVDQRLTCAAWDDSLNGLMTFQDSAGSSLYHEPDIVYDLEVVIYCSVATCFLVVSSWNFLLANGEKGTTVFRELLAEHVDLSR